MRPVIGKTRIASGLVTDTVGSGGMAAIYKVWNERLEVFRAVKLLSLDALYDRFETEAKLTAKLRHQNIVEIYGVGEWNGLPYMEMEFIDGENMQQVLARYGRFPAAVCAAAAVRMADALAYAHGLTFSMGDKPYSGIIHRDLKPANIMFSKQGDIKLTDFGIARPTQASLHTTEGNIVGTLHYLSPEQMEGREVDQRSDIYSFGAVLYEMAAGSKTFPQESVAELMKRRAENRYKKLSDYDFPINPALAGIITRCLEASPKDRFQNAGSLIKELQKALAQLTDLTPQTILANFYPVTAGSTPYTKEIPGASVPPEARPAQKPLHIKSALVIIPAIMLALLSILYIAVMMAIPAPNTSPTPTADTATDPPAEPEIPPEPEAIAIPETTPAVPLPKTPEPRPVSEDGLIRDATAAMAAKDWNRAIRTLERPGAYKEKADLRALLLLEAYVESKNLENAQALLAAAAQTNDAHYFLTAGRYWLYTGNHAKALESLEASLTRPSIHKSRNAIFDDAIYYIAVVRSERFRAAPSEANRLAALDGWRRVQSACKSLPDSPRYERAGKEIAALN
ncbi:MAG: serine/threonine protein kinase [Chitinispirillia bacterium]|nr:serine/threonine protein kinase [Chitinispirillia bacterium]